LFNSIGLIALVLARERGASSAQLGVMVMITAAGGAGPLAAGILIAAAGAGQAALAYGLAYIPLGLVAAAAPVFRESTASALSET
jgi:hypothetical protein